MTTAYRTSDAVTGVTSPASFTIPPSPTVQAGDAFYAMYMVGGVETVTKPADFELLDAQQDGGDTWVLIRKILQAGDPGAVKEFSYTDAAFPHAGIIWAAISGADQTTPEDATPVWTLDTSGTTSHVADGIDVTTDQAYVFQLMMERTASANASFSAATGTVKQQAISSGSAVIEGCMVAQGNLAPGTGVGGDTITADSATSLHAGIWTIAVKPAVSTQVVGLTADVTVTGWTAVPSGATQLVNRTADGNDATYVESGVNPSSLVFRGSLDSALSGPPGRIRVRSNTAAGATQATVLIELIETTGGVDTVIASRTETGVGATLADYLLTLTQAEMAAIGDWTQLDVRTTWTVTA